MSNFYKRLFGILNPQQVSVGQIQSVETDGVTLTLPTGATIRAKGTGTVNAWVYVKEGVVAGPAPDLTAPENSTVIEI